MDRNVVNEEKQQSKTVYSYRCGSVMLHSVMLAHNSECYHNPNCTVNMLVLSHFNLAC